MIIGVPKEIKEQEQRVALLPSVDEPTYQAWSLRFGGKECWARFRLPRPGLR